MTLLHLVSEQTMQNLLPLLALKPKTVVQVRSREDRFHLAAENLKRAVASLARTPPYCDLAPEFFEIVIDEASPSTDRTRRKVGESLSRWPGAVVNLTGGTKPMAIGAYLAAEYQRVPVLYCDTAERRFVSLNEECPLPALPDFEAIAATLTVEAVLAAHGRGPDQWQADTLTGPLLEFGQRAAAIRQSADSQEFVQFIVGLKKHFRRDGKYLSRVPPLLADTPLKRAYFEAAAAAGLLQCNDSPADRERALNGGKAPAVPAYVPVSQSRKANERLHHLLDGLWLELHVFELLRGNARFLDPQWSVKPAGKEADFGETDILCLDRERAGLLVVSCKSVAPLLEHFEALRRRTELFGGSHTQAVLCVFHAPAHAEDCRRWAKSLNIRLLLGAEEIAAFFQSQGDRKTKVAKS